MNSPDLRARCISKEIRLSIVRTREGLQSSYYERRSIQRILHRVSLLVGCLSQLANSAARTSSENIPSLHIRAFSITTYACNPYPPRPLVGTMAKQIKLFLIRHGETVDNVAQV